MTALWQVQTFSVLEKLYIIVWLETFSHTSQQLKEFYFI